MSDERAIRERGLPPRTAWITAGASAVVCIASLDASLAVLRDAGAIDSALQLAPTAALLALFVGVAFAIAAFAVRRLLPHASRTRSAGVASGLAIGMISGFALAWIGRLTALSTFENAPLAAAAHAALVAVVALLSAAGAGLFAERLADETKVLRVVTMLGIALAGAAAALACLWVGPASWLCAAPAIGVAAALILVASRASGSGLAWIGIALVATTLAAGVLGAPRPSTGAPPAVAGAPANAPRKVILLTVDTLRRDAIGAYAPSSRTPNLDSLARDSVVFERAYSAAPWTVPSFVSMFTGLSALTHGVNHNFAEIPAEHATLAEAMRRGGYATAALGDQVQLLRMGRGFDRYQLGPPRSAVHPATTAGRLVLRANRTRAWSDPEVTAAAVASLRERAGDDLFLWVHWIAPHVPYAPAPEFLPVTPLVARFGSAFDGKNSSVHTGRSIRTPEEREWLRELYAAEVRGVDAHVGRVLDELRALGLYDDALIVFT
ncbi:MAG TPA: sulfatase, partial [Myxococcota bacterium]|nr:sulfatase [Myxococcota bacterium]